MEQANHSYHIYALVGASVPLRLRVQASEADLHHEGTSLVRDQLILFCQVRTCPLNTTYEKVAMAMKIDPITTGDVPILEQLAYEYNRELDPQETRQEAVNRWITSVAEATAAGRHFFWLARVEEQLTGFVSFRLSTNPFTQETYGFIEDLYIAPSFRRRGYAEELARAAFAEISRQGASKIQLDVLVNNEKGLAFWRKLGLALHHYVLEMPVPR